MAECYICGKSDDGVAPTLDGTGRSVHSSCLANQEKRLAGWTEQAARNDHFNEPVMDVETRFKKLGIRHLREAIDQLGLTPTRVQLSKLSRPALLSIFAGEEMALEAYVNSLNGSALAVGNGDEWFQQLRNIASQFDMPADEDAMNNIPPVDSTWVYKHPEVDHLASLLAEDMNVLLVGPTGCGKSSLVEQLGAHMRWPVIRFAASNGLTEEAFVGEWVIRNDGEGAVTVFNYGVLPRSMEMGAILLIDEINALEPGVAFAIFQVLEKSRKLVLVQNGGEIVIPSPTFRFIVTTNTLGLADDRGAWTGTRIMNPAFLDRFAAVFQMDYLSVDQETSVLQKRVPDCPKDMCESFANWAHSIREAFTEGSIDIQFSTRRLVDLARAYALLDDVQWATKLTVLSRLSKKDKGTFSEVFQRVTGLDLVSLSAKDNAEEATTSQAIPSIP